MKIKYLKIRNIASIESGDIDFENGLTDKETGEPSALFLITGDTGSGKSVILDCISMALYGSTPRVKGVNGIKNNVYTNNEGEEISVNDIRQYTRIGISWRDDCYAELSFKGNDGIDYVSKYSLGRTSHRNYRDPVWKLIIGDSIEITNRKDEIRETIQKAVGLSFEQFSRMAMLAQGQFATFLTGKKEERERILEQLTATDIFSRYGEAISNLHKRAKQQMEMSEKIYEEFGKQILKGETRMELLSEQDDKQRLATGLKSETDKLRQRISHIEGAIKSEKNIEALKIEAEKFKAMEESPEFKQRTALIDLWDKTENERKILSDKLETTQRKNKDLCTLQELKAEFNILSDDLAKRKDAASERTKLLEEESNWLKSKEPLSKTYADASVTSLKINTYISLLKELEQKEKEALSGKELIKNLSDEVRVQEKTVKEKSEENSLCQLKIKQKSKNRDILDQRKIRIESERLLKRKHSLLDLSSSIAKARMEKEDIEKAENEITETSNLLCELKEKAAKTASDCEKAEKDKVAAEKRHMTMYLSLDKNFKDLRRKLAEEHAENCPLCGQSITEHLKEWRSEEYFKDLLYPLEEEKIRLTDVYSKARKASDEAIKILNSTDGSLKAKETELKKRKKNLAKTEVEIKERIEALEVADNEEMSESIDRQLAEIETAITKISEKLAAADKIQKEIDELIKQKEILDKLYRVSDSILQESVRKLTMANESVKNAEARIKELRTETNDLEKTITEAMKGFSEDWRTNPASEVSRLQKDANEFADRTSRYAKDNQDHEKILKAIESLSAVQKKLLNLLNTVGSEAEGVLTLNVKSLKIETLQKKWNDFLIEVSTVISRRNDNELKIKKLEEELSEYYLITGTTETTLFHLLSAVKEVNDARLYLQGHRDERNKTTTLLSEAQKSKKDNLNALNIEDISQLEDPEELKRILDSSEKQIVELSEQLGLIKGRLEEDEKSQKKSAQQLKDLEEKTIGYEKWDKMNRYFGGTKFRTLVQSHILRPLLNNANIYLKQITDHYTLTCSDENEHLSILVHDRYHNNEPRSVTVLSGGERFIISLALSLALSSMNRPDMNVDILFIDEGFGTLDIKSLETVMNTLRRLPEINGHHGRRVGVISHREELAEQIACQIQLHRSGEGRSRIVISNA